MATSTAAPTAYDRGYADQQAWLAGKTLSEAEHALDGRRATVNHDSAYNRGGTDATEAYVVELRGASTTTERTAQET